MTPVDPLWFLALACALCVAAGLSLYATLAAVGLLSLAGLATLPPRLVGLEAPLVWGPLLIFYAAEAALARTDGADLLADAAHVGIRPLGAALLGATAVTEFGTDLQWLMAAVGAALAFWSHNSRAGLALLLRTSRRPDRVSICATAAEGAAVAIVLLGALWPPAAVGLAGLVLLAPIPWASRLWNAARAGRQASWAALTYPFHGRAWRGAEVLPPRFAAALDAAVGSGARIHRIAPAVARRLPGVPPLTSGWLTFTSRGAYFVFRGFRRPRAAPLPGGPTASRGGRLFDLLEVRGAEPAEFLLPKNAPRPHTLPTHLESPAGPRPS